MILRIPVYVQGPRKGAPGGGAYLVRALFHAQPTESHASLRRALGRLRRTIRTGLREQGRQGRHDALADWVFHPSLESGVIEMNSPRSPSGGPYRAFYALFRALDRRIAWLPDHHLSLAIERGEDPDLRVTEALEGRFRRLTKDGNRDQISGTSLPGPAWISVVEVELELSAPEEEDEEKDLLRLGGGGSVSGAQELEKVGVDLGDLWPDELDRVWFREREVETLRTLVDERYVRPVLLLGPSGAGKSGLVHEWFHRRKEAERRLKPSARKRGSVWRLHPQRLISGMSFVGQWEQRLHAILDHAERARHVLWLDDLVGLFYAGISAGSNLTIGHVLKETLVRSRLRVVGEATPEVFRVLREIDRGFADLFRVLPVAPLDPATTMRVLVRAARTYERRHRRTVTPGAFLPVVQLQQRYQPREALPGKAVRFLERVCSAKREGSVSGADVLDEFARASGLNRRFLDVRASLEAREVRDFLRARIIGQEEAVEALVDVVMLAKARLNEPGRPPGVLLFLGPTGVGKTECAKALAAFLFGSEDRLLRFDMNEYVDSGSGARLVGDRARPDGLLTAAVRRQPFGVILLDEIEKAHPEVHDLLLQVLGEGRLTDARGETADFGNAVVLMTSNLGAAEVAARVGIGEDAADRREAWVRSAERFFRPEFFNRLDRVIPFHPLDPGQVRRVAELRMRELLAREGLVRRRVLLEVDPWALDRVAELGYHPQLGARALKRELEERVTRPVAALLAATMPARPVVLRLFAGAGDLALEVRPLADVAPVPERAGPEGRPEEALARLTSEVARLRGELQAWRPPEAVSVSALSERDRLYFGLRQLLEDLRRRLERSRRRVEAARRGRLGAAGVQSGGKVMRKDPARRSRIAGDRPPAHQEWSARLAAAEHVREFAAEVLEGARLRAVEDPFDLAGLGDALAHLDAAVRSLAAGEEPSVLLAIREGAPGDASSPRRLLDLYAQVLAGPFAGEITLPPTERAESGLWGLAVRGPGLGRLLAGEEGVHLEADAAGRLHALHVRTLPIAEGRDPREALRALAAEREAWREGLRAGTRRLEEDPYPVGRLVRYYDGGAQPMVFDVRTARAAPADEAPRLLRTALLAGILTR